MKSKKDMYINYERSYKKRGGRRPGWMILILMLMIGLGTATYFIIKTQTASGAGSSRDGSSPEDGALVSAAENTTDSLPAEAQGDSVKSIPIITPTLIATPSPTPTITLTPTPEVAPSDVAAGSNQTATKVEGIYVTAPTAGTDYLTHLIELADTTEINAMVIDVKDDHGKISYHMDSAMAKEIGSTTNTIADIDLLIKTLKDKNIYLIARIVAFKDPFLAEKRQDLAVKNPDGSLFRDSNGEAWVNPYKRDVWNYLAEVASEAAKAGFDEVQFDYIRFSTGLGISKADFGEESKVITKEEIITEFTKYIYETLKPLGVFVAADVYGTIINSSVDAALVGQNYVEMAKYLDYICPMIYPSHFGEGNYGIKYPDLEPYNIINKVLTVSKEKLDQIPEGEHKAIVRPWLQDFTASWIKHYKNYGAEELRAQIDGVYSVGYDEWLLWNAASNYTEEGLNKE